ncbi:hypothetical protein JIN84_00145 [Luteolibacter yonseiensis]|uniref:AB hydrolase-1 domain-containing protein n=1 Tax=Luteolibacter yonseiensis TaxID=1144680 RepID=A0A934QZC9_9BACT|nr:hypothetical protein [Luteolibacter yonseiensis]MBK1814016.1 hypothetical protein [Luteolibacter yonseiensis]
MHRILPFCLSLAITVCFSSCACLKRPQKEKPPLPERFQPERSITTCGKSWPVNVTRTGTRPILLLHELNGQSPGALDLALELEQAGCKVYVPRFYGSYGSDLPATLWPFVVFSPDWSLYSKQGGPVRNHIRELAIKVQAENPHEKLTVIGNCMTGGQALGLLALPQVETVVVCQPAVPMLPWTPSRKKALGIPEADVSAAIAALDSDSKKKLISINYLEDPVAIIERTARLAERTMALKEPRQHRLRIGIPDGPHRGLPVAIARHPGYEKISVETCGHSTVTGAADPGDREAFRKALFEELRLKPLTKNKP